MIALIEPLPAGNAIRLILSPPPGARQARILRRVVDPTADPPTAIPGPDDPGAVLVADWGDYLAVVDTDGLVNGVEQLYRAFYRNAAGQPILPHAPARKATPSYTARDTSAPVLRLVRERVAMALANAVAAGRLHPASGQVPVVQAPLIAAQAATFPIVSVHLERDQPVEFGIGNILLSDDELLALGWDETTGWIAEVTINVVGVTNNPDERITLGEVLQHAIVANLDVFAAHALIRPTLSMSHSEIAPETTNAPLYVAAGTFSCLAARSATATASEIANALVAASMMEDTP